MYNQLLLFSLFERFFLLVIFKINNCVSHRPAIISSSHSIRKTPYPPSLSHSHPFADKRGRDKRGLWDVSIHGETPRPFFLDAICTYMLYKTSSIKIFFCCVIEIACDTCQIIGLYNWNLYSQRRTNTYYYDHWSKSSSFPFLLMFVLPMLSLFDNWDRFQDWRTLILNYCPKVAPFMFLFHCLQNFSSGKCLKIT